MWVLRPGCASGDRLICINSMKHPWCCIYIGWRTFIHNCTSSSADWRRCRTHVLLANGSSIFVPHTQSSLVSLEYMCGIFGSHAPSRGMAQFLDFLITHPPTHPLAAALCYFYCFLRNKIIYARTRAIKQGGFFSQRGHVLTPTYLAEFTIWQTYIG